MTTLTIQYRHIKKGWQNRTVVVVFHPAVLEDEIAALVRSAPNRWTVCPGCSSRIERTGVLTLRRPGRETRRWLVRVRLRVGASLVLPAKSSMRSSTPNALCAIIPPCCSGSRPWLGRADAPSSLAATHGSSTARRFMGGSPPLRLGSGIKSTAALEDGGGCARCGPAGAGRSRPAPATSVGREPPSSDDRKTPSEIGASRTQLKRFA